MELFSRIGQTLLEDGGGVLALTHNSMTTASNVHQVVFTHECKDKVGVSVCVCMCMYVYVCMCVCVCCSLILFDMV